MKVPDDAFERYVALGPDRSYQGLAEKLGVDKRSIVRAATRDRWAERLANIQEEARAATDRKLVADLQAVRERQLQEARALRGWALRAMKDLPPEKALKAVTSALSTAWKQELLLLGEPTDRQASTVEEVTKREMHTLLSVADPGEEEEEEPIVEAVETIDEPIAAAPCRPSNAQPLFPRYFPPAVKDGYANAYEDEA